MRKMKNKITRKVNQLTAATLTHTYVILTEACVHIFWCKRWFNFVRIYLAATLKTALMSTRISSVKSINAHKHTHTDTWLQKFITYILIYVQLYLCKHFELLNAASDWEFVPEFKLHTYTQVHICINTYLRACAHALTTWQRVEE